MSLLSFFTKSSKHVDRDSLENLHINLLLKGQLCFKYILLIRLVNSTECFVFCRHSVHHRSLFFFIFRVHDELTYLLAVFCDFSRCRLDKRLRNSSLNKSKVNIFLIVAITLMCQNYVFVVIFLLR